ncbi:MAG: metallophosphoesterase [Fimbriimonadaceae bacterium]|nr:metallophosphoesterase [Fimbriimonadaceae bacterium]
MRFQYRAVFISDLHLGSITCNAEAIQTFLVNTDCETLYLVGDIMDMWVSRKKGKWRQEHTDIVSSILSKARQGTDVFLTPGNHDSEFRRLNGIGFGNIHVDHEFCHTTLEGKRLWVIHGDYLDRSVTTLKWLAYLGAWVHEGLGGFNVFWNRWAKRLGRPPSDFSGLAKKRVKDFVQYFTNFDDRITVDAKNAGYDGVVCGHIHKPAFVEHETGALYINTGDWMKHCTALVEHLDGRLELVHWADLRATFEGAMTSKPEPSLPFPS